MATDVLIMGPPGSGKGTQAERLAKRRSLAHISTGDMLRAAMDAGSELGKQVKAIVERGDLVPDPLMLELVDERLRQPDAQTGFILDGFPRTVAQAEGLLELLERKRRSLDFVVVLQVPQGVLVERAVGRGRTDDNEETIRHRLQVYERQTEPVLGFLDGRVPRRDVDGVGAIEEITERIERALDAAENPDQERR